MKAFAAMYLALDQTTSLNDKQRVLTAYFRAAAPADGAWTVALLSGRRPKKPVTSRELKDAVLRYLKIPEWVLTESYEQVGDLGETLALLIDTLREQGTEPANPGSPASPLGDESLASWMEQRLPSLAAAGDGKREELLISWWAQLDTREIFVLHKLITGSFRVGVSASLVIKSLAAAGSLPLAVITQRLTGKWTPSAAFYERLLASTEDGHAADPAQPFPFALAYPLDGPAAELGALSEWSAEWKWDGIRAQIVCREGVVYIWSRGEDLVTEAFPELAAAALARFPAGTVVDGEILAFDAGRPLPFAALQKRLGRKKVSAAVQAATPVHFLAYDLLEFAGVDWREEPLAVRRQTLATFLDGAASPFGLSPQITADSWDDLALSRIAARSHGAEGLMLKRLSSPYRAGRRRGDWWKWKVDPLVIDAVLLYAQAGSGRRANLFTDYTFAVWDGKGGLVPIAKAYSGLDQAEIAELDKWIRAHTKEKFGPVRSLEAVQVFELGFEGIQASTRHKAGLALRFPRILRWRHDKPAAEADTLETARALLQGLSSAASPVEDSALPSAADGGTGEPV